nr:unnamed protein product [Callosobruchus chinensis]
MFEWRWDDIANECETFLGPKGFAGVQVSFEIVLRCFAKRGFVSILIYLGFNSDFKFYGGVFCREFENLPIRAM